MAEIRIGTSGYQYKHWKGDFYPDDLPISGWFDHYVKFFDTVEINNTFYRMADADTFDQWRKAAPKDFLYAIKYSRFGTHLKKLKEPEGHVNYFLDRVLHLKEALGPVLVQLPPKWKPDLERLDAFLTEAPRELRWAIEVREKQWLGDDLYALLQRHQAALVVHDMIPNHAMELTTTWTYFRFHGQNYSGDYSDKQLEEIAANIREIHEKGCDVYVYFNNDLGGYSPRNALSLKEKLGH